MSKLTNEQLKEKLDAEKKAATEKAETLSNQMGVKVHPIIFVDDASDDILIGFISEPNRITKTRVLDKGLTSPATAAAELLEAILLKEHSDRRIYEERPENDKFYHGAAMAAYDLVSIAVNQSEKKK